MRLILAIAIALVPMFVVALAALLTGHAPLRDQVEAGIVTAMLLGFVAYRRRIFLKPSALPPVRTAEISPLRCGCDPKSEHPQMGARPIPCSDEDADWWFASEDQDDLCVWQKRFDSRAEAEQALVERGWKSVNQWVPAS